MRVACLSLAVLLSGCCFFPSPGDEGDDVVDTPAEDPASGPLTVDSVVFARGIDAQFELIGGEVTAFRADETEVHARVMIRGRPNEGAVTMRRMWRDLEMARADVNLGDVNGGVLFSFGTNTAIRGNLTAPQLYIGDGHRLVLMHGERELGSYTFNVVPPEGARPSRFISADVYANDPRQGDPGAPTRAFTPMQTVYVIGQAAVGHESWFDAVFTVNGQVDTTLTQEMIGPPDGGDPVNFVLHALPPNGWPVGPHRVALVLNDQEVAAYDFTVAAQ